MGSGPYRVSKSRTVFKTSNCRAHNHVQSRPTPYSGAERRFCPAQFHPGAERAAADLAFVLVGGRRVGTLPQTGKTRTAHHSMAGERLARLDRQRAMTGSMLASQVPDYSDDTSLVIPEQAPIRVFTDDGGVVVINQHQWRESEDEVYILFRPEHAAALCRAILKEAGIDPDKRGPEVTVKDGTANERQRRRREKL